MLRKIHKYLHKFLEIGGAEACVRYGCEKSSSLRPSDIRLFEIYKQNHLDRDHLDRVLKNEVEDK